MKFVSINNDQDNRVARLEQQGDGFYVQVRKLNGKFFASLGRGTMINSDRYIVFAFHLNAKTWHEALKQVTTTFVGHCQKVLGEQTEGLLKKIDFNDHIQDILWKGANAHDHY